MSNSQFWALNSFRNSEVNWEILIDGVNVPFAQLTIQNRLNDIPKATVNVSLGRSVRTKQQSAVYGLASQLKQMASVRIQYTGSLGDWSPEGDGQGKKKQWPGGKHILFIGYVSGLSYKRAAGQVFLSIDCIGRLFDLACSSGGAANVLPGAPHDLMLPTLLDGAGGSTVALGSDLFTDELPDDMPSDWSKGILKALKFVAEESQIQTHDASEGPWCRGVSNPIARQKNDRALRALEGVGEWKGFSNLVDNQFTEAYPLDVNGEQSLSHIAKVIGQRIQTSVADHTLWSILVSRIIPDFGVYVVPLSDQALLVPIIPMNREAYKTVTPSEYLDFNFRMMSQRPLYGVGVMGNFSNSSLGPEANTNKRCVGATYVSDTDGGEGEPDGAWAFVQAPSWMDSWVATDSNIANPASVKMLSETSNTVDGGQDANIDRDLEAESDEFNNIMQKFAKMMYATQALKGRRGVLTGKLRFDISPGSTIIVQGRGEASTPGIDRLAQNLYGLVNGVTINIDAERSIAATTFELGNLRTAAENATNRFSMPDHPFFSTSFKGAPLVSTLEIT